MTIDFRELTGGDMSLKGSSVVRKFRMTGIPHGSFDAFDFVADYCLNPSHLARTITSMVGTLHIQDIQIQEISYGRAYLISVPYGINKGSSGSGSGSFAGAYQITNDSTGGTVNVKAGRRIAGYVKSPYLMVDSEGLIGVEGDDVKGIDIPVEQSKITVMFRHPQGILNDAYIDRTNAIVGFPNSDRFLGRDPGEMLYKGGSFSETNTEGSATYNFDRSPNRTNFVVGGITVAEKKGWDVLSFHYADYVFNGGSGNVAAKRLKCLEVVRPREWVSYVTAFGWGG